MRDLRAWYGDSQSLFGMTFDIRDGEVVTLLGRNGAGKSTTLKSIIGMIEKKEGAILYRGADLTNLVPEKIAHHGIAFCPEDRGIYSSLTVEENLLLPPLVAPGGMTLEEIYQLFPNLLERKASWGTDLSGGELQMLAIGRILRTGAKLLLLDEPTEGLAPVIVEKIGKVIQALKQRGLTILLVEQNVRFAAMAADRHFVVEHGRVIDMVTAEDFHKSGAKLAAYLSI